VIQIPNSAIVSYLTRFAVGSVYVVVPPGRDCVIVGAAVDLAQALSFIVRKYKMFTEAPPDLVAAWWCDRRAAGRICGALVGNPRCGVLPQSNAVAASTASKSMAARYSVPLSEHQVVLERAKAAAEKIAVRVEGARTSGVLSAFNTEFRRRRLEAQREGRGFLTYSAMSKLNRTIASCAATGGVATPIAIFNEVFK
jgi:hypothetical protein